MKFDVQGKVALVTGANRGIGKAIVDSLVQHGAKKVYAAVRSMETAGPLVNAYGNKVVPVHVDLNQPETISAAAGTASDVQLVVNNAGVFAGASPLAGNALESLQYHVNINVAGLIRMAQAFAPVLKANGGGAFVQLNSVASLRCFSDFSIYAASKAAAYSITQGLRDKLGEQGTLVISVHPGPIATDMADQAGLGEIAEPPSLVSESIIEALKSGEFHVFPDTMAKQIGSQYENFARNFVEANLMDG